MTNGVARIKLGLADSLSLGNLDWQEHVRIDPAFLRPAEVDHLIGNPTKAKFDLDWEPTVDFDRLIRPRGHREWRVPARVRRAIADGGLANGRAVLRAT